MARPSRFAEVAPTLVHELAIDGDLPRACAVAGVGRRTVYEWLERGRDPKDVLHARFRDEVAKATAVGARAKHDRTYASLDAGLTPPKRLDLRAISDSVVAAMGGSTHDNSTHSAHG